MFLRFTHWVKKLLFSGLNWILSSTYLSIGGWVGAHPRERENRGAPQILGFFLTFWIYQYTITSHITGSISFNFSKTTNLACAPLCAPVLPCTPLWSTMGDWAWKIFWVRDYSYLILSLLPENTLRDFAGKHKSIFLCRTNNRRSKYA